MSTNKPVSWKTLEAPGIKVDKMYISQLHMINPVHSVRIPTPFLLSNGGVIRQSGKEDTIRSAKWKVIISNLTILLEDSLN